MSETPDLAQESQVQAGQTQAGQAREIQALQAQVERLSQLVERSISQQAEYQAAQRARWEELATEFSPIGREVMDTAVIKLAEAERDGWFRLGGGLYRLGARVAARYQEDDWAALEEAVISILDTARRLTQPDMLAAARDAAGVLARADQVEPLGVLGVIRATGDQEVQRGMAVMLELLRRVGRAAHGGLSEADPAQVEPSRSAPTKIAPVAKIAPLVQPAPAKIAPAKPAPAQSACAVPAPDPAAPDPKAWTPEIGEAEALAAGIAMTDAHRAVIKAARDEFFASGASPNIRRITQIAGIDTKAVYALFPKAPGRTIARVAWLPKPAGCI